MASAGPQMFTMRSQRVPTQSRVLGRSMILSQAVATNGQYAPTARSRFIKIGINRNKNGMCYPQIRRHAGQQVRAVATAPIRLTPSDPAPNLEVATLEGTQWKLSEQKPKNYTMVLFYRGKHCPLCAKYLQGLEEIKDKYDNLGVDIIAISGDPKEKAQQSTEQWGLTKLTIGYALSLDSMKDWGLYVSKGEFEQEPDLFCEPGLFLLQPDGRIYFAGINNVPFGRTDLKSLLSGLEYIQDKNYPTRGTLV